DGYTVLRIDDVAPIQAIAEPFQIRLLRRELGVQAFGINAYTAPAAGDRVIEEHDELGGGAAGHEELYLVVSGKATFIVDGAKAELGAGGLVHVPDPASRRSATATEPNKTVLVGGGQPRQRPEQGGAGGRRPPRRVHPAGGRGANRAPQPAVPGGRLRRGDPD